MPASNVSGKELRRVVIAASVGNIIEWYDFYIFGSLATIAVAKARNLVIAVIDNGHFGETGMQTSHTGRGLNFADVAASCGFGHTATLTRIEEVKDLARGLGGAAEGPSLFVIKVAAENPPRSLPPRDAVFIKNRFRTSLDLAPT